MKQTSLARLSGTLYFLIIPFAVYSMLYVPGLLYERADIGLTLNNLKLHALQGYFAIAASLVAQIINIVLAVCLFVLFRKQSLGTALIMLVLFLVSVPITLTTDITQWLALNMVNTSQGNVQHGLLQLLMDYREASKNVAQFFWGLWLIPLARLVCLSQKCWSRWVSPLLSIAGLGYIFDSTAWLLEWNIGFVVSELTFVGELTFLLWLLVGYKKA